LRGRQYRAELKSQEVDLDLNLVLQGIKDAMGASRSWYPTRNPRSAASLLEGSPGKFEKNANSWAKESEGGRPSCRNKDKPGIKTLPDGLQYKVITKEQVTPKATDKVKVRYRGTLIDGRN